MGDSDDEYSEKTLKIAVVGDGNSGKTSIITRFSQDVCSEAYNQTLGIDFFTKHIQLPGNLHVALNVHDIGGQTIGGNMLDKYIYGAHGVLLVYDITSTTSFTNLMDWLTVAKRVIAAQQRKEKVHIALVANKTDLTHLRAVTNDQHMRFAKEQDIVSSHFVSAKSGDSVSLVFRKVAASILNVKLSRAEMESENKVITAQIVNYKSNENGATGGASTSRKNPEEAIPQSSSKMCSVM